VHPERVCCGHGNQHNFAEKTRPMNFWWRWLQWPQPLLQLPGGLAATAARSFAGCLPAVPRWAGAARPSRSPRQEAPTLGHRAAAKVGAAGCCPAPTNAQPGSCPSPEEAPRAPCQVPTHPPTHSRHTTNTFGRQARAFPCPTHPVYKHLAPRRAALTHCWAAVAAARSAAEAWAQWHETAAANHTKNSNAFILAGHGMAFAPPPPHLHAGHTL
jgi:hypothetical protein